MVQGSTSLCQKCGKSHAASMQVCPFCGQRRRTGEVGPVAASRATPPPMGMVFGRAPPLPGRSTPPPVVAGTSCFKCQSPLRSDQGICGRCGWDGPRARRACLDCGSLVTLNAHGLTPTLVGAGASAVAVAVSFLFGVLGALALGLFLAAVGGFLKGHSVAFRCESCGKALSPRWVSENERAELWSQRWRYYVGASIVLTLAIAAAAGFWMQLRSGTGAAAVKAAPSAILDAAVRQESSMVVEQLLVGSMRNFAYLVGVDGEAAIIDPAAEPKLIEQELRAHGLKPRYVINTHSHFDHIGGNAHFQALGAKLAAYENTTTHPDIVLHDGDELPLGSITLRALHTPGHSPDSIVLVTDGYLFTGDTLFVGECGRVDLPGSDPTAMHHSLLTVLRGLPDDLVVMPGHDYGPARKRALGVEKRENYTLAPRSLEAFLQFMSH